MNQFNAVGRLTAKPILRSTQSGKKVASFTLAISATRKDEQALFIECSTWEQKADIMEKYTDKGSQIAIVGSLKSESWEDKQTGAKRSKTVCTVSSITLLSKMETQSETAPATNQAVQQAKIPAVGEIELEDLHVEMPF